MTAGAATHTLNVTAAHDAQSWATRAQVEQEIARNPFTNNMRPVRVHNRFWVFWVAGMVLHSDGVRVVLRYLRTDRRTAGIVLIDTPGAPFPPAGTWLPPVDVPTLSGDIAERHQGRRLLVCARLGELAEITVVSHAGDYVDVVNHSAGDQPATLYMPHLAVVRGATHKISYSAGSQIVIDGPPSYDLSGREFERAGYFWSAWCSCGQFRHSDAAGAGARRHAVASHLADVGVKQS